MIEKLPDTEVVKEGWIYQYLALACMALGRWEEAIEAWKGYVNMGEGKKETFVLISFCFLKMDQIDMAYKNYILSIYNYEEIYPELKSKFLESFRIFKIDTVNRGEITYMYINPQKVPYNIYESELYIVDDIKNILAKKGKVAKELREEDRLYIIGEVKKYLEKYGIKSE